MISPNILEWTVLPFEMTAKAWTDSDFLTELTSNPNGVIRAAVFEVPWSYSFIIKQDTGGTRYLTLPILPSFYDSWSEEEILKQLIKETHGDISMQYCLPAWIIKRAFFDESFKNSLLSSELSGANSALTSAGYDTPSGVTFVVNENTATNHYLTLPEQPLEWKGLGYDNLLQRLILDGNQIITNRVSCHEYRAPIPDARVSCHEYRAPIPDARVSCHEYRAPIPD